MIRPPSHLPVRDESQGRLPWYWGGGVAREIFFFAVTALVGASAVVVLVLLYRRPDLIPRDFLPAEYRPCVYVGVGGLAAMSLVASVQLVLDLASG